MPMCLLGGGPYSLKILLFSYRLPSDVALLLSLDSIGMVYERSISAV